jgi:hypothetical protein
VATRAKKHRNSKLLTPSNRIARPLKLIDKLPLPNDNFAKDASAWFETDMKAAMLEALAHGTPLWTPANSTAATVAPTSELLVVPNFDVSWLPDPFCASVSEISDQIQLPPAYAGAGTIEFRDRKTVDAFRDMALKAIDEVSALALVG